MSRAIYCVLALLLLSACVSEPLDPSFMGAREIDTAEAAKTRVSLGLTYLKNGNFTQAKFNLDKALEFAPRDGQAHFAMAFYYQTVGEAALAEESYENALNFSKDDPDVVNSYGAFLCQEGRYEEAKGYFLQAVNDRNYASTAETYENLAICSQSQGFNAEAIEYFTSALNHQPSRLQSLYLLSNLYITEEQWDDAKRTLFKYERLAPVSAETLYMQFQIARGLNDTETAVGYGEILKTMFPEHQNTKKYLAELGKFKPAANVTLKTLSSNQSTELNPAPLAETSITQDTIQNPEPSDLVETPAVTQAASAATEASVLFEGNALEDTAVEDNVVENTIVEDTSVIAATDAALTVVEETQAETQANIQQAQTVLETTQAAEALASADTSEITESVVAAIPTSDNATLDNAVANNAIVDNATPDVAISDERESVIEDEIQSVEQEALEPVEELAEQVDTAATDAVDDALVASEEQAEKLLEQATLEQATDAVAIAEEPATLNELDTESQLQAILDSEAPDPAPIVTSELSEENTSLAESLDDIDSLVEDAESEQSSIPDEALHIVQKNETLSRIARKYDLTVSSLMEWNNLDTTVIEIGTRLRVKDPSLPAIPEEALHIVQKQENLYRISLRYNVKMRVLMEWNNLEDTTVKTGMQLWVRDPSRYE